MPERKQKYEPLPKHTPPFYILESRLLSSKAYLCLRRDDVFVFNEYLREYSIGEEKNLCVPWGQVKGRITSHAFSRAKLRLRAFGFLYVVRFGRLEHNCTIMGLSGKWQHFENHPGKLDRIERLLKRHWRIMRIPLKEITVRRRRTNPTNPEFRPRMRKFAILRRIEHQIFKDKEKGNEKYR